MAVTVKKAVLWRKEIDNRPGMLADTLEPLSEAGADLQVVTAYRDPGGTDTAVIELHPVSGRKSTSAAKTASLAPSPISALLVQGDNR
jgi:ACT domain-containing protein